MKKYLFLGILVVIIMVQLVLIFIQDRNNVSEYSRNMMYMDTHIGLKVYNIDEDKAEYVLDKANEIFKDYHDLSTRYEANSYNNIFYINNLATEDYIVIDERLYEMIDYGVLMYHLSGGIKNINLGNLIDLWSSYRDSHKGLPTLEELEKVDNTSIEDIVLKEGNLIKNNNLNLDLGSIAKGYAVEVVGQMLRDNDVNSFLINAGGNVLVGDHHSGEEFRIGLQDPLENSGIFTIVKGENIAVVTSGGYERYFEYDGQKYGHIIDPRTLFPANKNKSVSVITDCSKKADGLALSLFVMDYEKGIKFLEEYENVEAIWFTADSEIKTTPGFKNYEL